MQADPGLTEHVWDKSAVKPFVLAPANHASRLKDERTAGGDPYVYRFPAMDLIGHLLTGRPNQRSYDWLIEVLQVARRHFAIGEEERLALTVVGSHTSISGAMIAGYKQEGGNLDYLNDAEFLPGMRRHRQLAGLLGAGLRMLPRVETPWLATAFPELCPTAEPPDADLVELAGRARLDLDVLAFENGENDVRLSRPALPLIYVRKARGRVKSHWQPLGPVEARAPYWTTDSLIGQFKIASETQPGLEGVLVKLVGDLTDLYCPVDAPVVGERTFERAAGLNISAILLDSRLGILRPQGLATPLRPPVYGV